MNKTVVKGGLMDLERIQEETGNTNTPVFRQYCGSYLNHYGAVSILDSLSAEDIEESAFEFMKKNVDHICKIPSCQSKTSIVYFL